eukprot:TRINITY_DN12377_c0_g1_i1.p1 TRINITY_DN12377_c0_g1~~TRINITY_DN12377_c0_g1_i1.p1  ORF type:complete len:335 (+),score=84.58 TRINITY_DN12377_c0_g1_i1:85-1005(+)
MAALFAFAAATALDDYCEDIGTRGGCAGCEAAVDCTWCGKARDTMDSQCFAGASCDATSEYTLSASQGRLCPSDPSEYQAPIRNFAFDPTNEEMIKNSLRYTSFHDENFCGFGFDFPVDRWAFSNQFNSDAHTSDSVCGYTNNYFGFPMNGNQKRACKRAVGNDSFNGLKISSKEELIDAVADYCDVIEDSNQPINPYQSEEGIECVRLLKQAYCSVGCSDYNTAAGRPCMDSNDYLELVRLCPYEDNGCSACPLDPTNLLALFGNGEPSACDSNLRAIEETTLFGDEFGLHDGLDAAPQQQQLPN